MKTRRILLISSVLIIFFICFFSMNQKFDRLSRYGYDDPKAKALIDKYMTDEEIEYIIEYSIEPGSFIKYVKADSFNIFHLSSYDTVSSYLYYQTPEEIVEFTEKISAFTNLKEVLPYLSQYRYQEVLSFYQNKDSFMQEATLAKDPENLNFSFSNNETVHTHYPFDLVKLDEETGFQLRKEAAEAYVLFMEDLIDELSLKKNPVNIERAFLSYEELSDLYDQGLLDKELPGHNEHQLGLAADIRIDESFAKNENNMTCFKEIAKKYGFVLGECELGGYHLRYRG